MLYGCDVSHWNSDSILETQKNDFVIIKASEGKMTKDKTFDSKLDKCASLGIDLVGAYHYARPLNNVEDDVTNFLQTIEGRHELGKNMILALDLEENMNDALTYHWALKWLQSVYAFTKIKPVIYTSASYTKYMDKIADADFGLWVAHWNVKKPKINNWKFWAFWQYTVNKELNLDLDKFNGTKEQFLKYCERS